jgi:hypothetical protein
LTAGGEKFTHPQACTMQAGANSPDRDAQRVRYLVVGEIGPHKEEQRIAILARQGCQGQQQSGTRTRGIEARVGGIEIPGRPLRRFKPGVGTKAANFSSVMVAQEIRRDSQ